MTSKISYFKIALEDVRHRVWMLALSCLGSFLALPVMFLLANSHYMSRYENYCKQAMDIAQAKESLLAMYVNFFASYGKFSCGIILSIGAIIVGVFGFRFLYSKKMVDLYHSMPLKREHGFLITYINGFLIWLLPMLISTIITLLLMTVNLSQLGIDFSFLRLLGKAGELILLCLVAFMTVYHFCLMCVMVSGNAFNCLCLVAIGGTASSIIWLLLQAYCENYFVTYCSYNTSFYSQTFASPLVNAVILLLKGIVPSAYNSLTVSSLVMSLVMIVLFFVAAFLLYKRRPSELAEHGVRNKWVQTIVRIVISIIAGLTCSLIFLAVLGEIDGIRGWCIFACILGAALVFGLMDIIFHMDFKAFLRHKWQMLVTVGIACAILPIFWFDVTGFNKRLPEADEIAKVSLHISDFSERSFDDIPWITLEDYSDIHALLASLTDDYHLSNPGVPVIIAYVHVEETNGQTYNREYRILEEDIELLRPIVEHTTYQKTYFPFSTGMRELPKDMSLESTIASMSYNELSVKEMEILMEAYQKDFAEHNTLDELSCGIEIARLSCYYDLTESRTNTYYSWSNFPIYDNYTYTMAAIRELFPDFPLTGNDLNIVSLQLNPSIAQDMPREALYSYFGLEGYPSYNDFLTQYYEEEESADKDGYYEMTTVDVETYMPYQASIENPEDIAELLPLLHFGDMRGTNISSDARDAYVFVGEAHLSDTGRRIPFYMEKGALPKKWIDAMEPTPY